MEVSTEKKTELTLSIKRIFEAPRDFVWDAWTDPELVTQWWGPKGFTSPFAEIDLKVGGKYLLCMRSPEGKDYWSTGVYEEILPIKRLVCSDSFSDEKGNIVPATYYGMSPDFPLEMTLTVTFEDVGGKTRLTVSHSGIPTGEDYDNAKLGWTSSLDKLEYLLENG